MTNNRLAIIVLNWNCADDSIKCIESLLDQDFIKPDVFLVDNASSDDSISTLQKFISQKKSAIHLIKSATNSGYAGGNNLGFSKALELGYEYIGTLNPDATANKSWTGSLIEELDKHPDTGITTGLILKENGKTIDTSGERYTSWGIPGPRHRDALREKAPKDPAYIFGSTGGGFIGRASALKKVGLFDERFFMYFEDVDLSFRMQLAGFKVRYTPKAIAYHKISASTNKVPGLAVTQTFKNLPMLFTKNVPFKLCFSIYPRFVLAYFLILGHAIVKGRGGPAIKGFAMSWTLIPHMFRERRRIQGSRVATDAYIDSIILHDIPPEQTGLRKFRKIFTRK